MNFNNENPLKVSVVIAGFIALIVQVIFLREFLAVFLGNELVAGVIIGNWMLLTAAGTRIGSAIKTSKNIPIQIIIAQLFIAVLPQVSVLLLAFFKSLFYPPGVLPGFVDTWIFSFLLMAPFCLVSGALFAIFLKAFDQISNSRHAPLIYGFEAVGSVAGGVLFTFLLLDFFTTFQSLLLLATANFGISLVLVLTSKIRRMYFHLILIFSLLVVALNLIFDFDKLSKSFIYGKQEIVLNEETPYGNLIVTKTGSQYNYFENGLSIFSTDNIITNEESVHYAMLQHPDPKRVLMVSGGISGMINEVLKYNISGIDYVEINPAIIEAGRRFAGFEESELLEIHNIDARTFIKQTEKKFDVVLLNVPPPSTTQLNCYFTQEFYQELKAKLNPGGVISTSLDGGNNYLGKEAANLHGILFQTLKRIFKNVLIIPGQANYFLASDAPLALDIVRRLENTGIENDYVNKYYLDDESIKMRALQLQQLFPTDSPINRDFHPVAYFTRINYWLSWFGMEINKIAAIVAVAFLVLLFFLNRQNQLMFFAGFTVSATEIMVLLAFQVVLGYFYHAMALLIAAFMAGLAMGTYLSGKDYLKYSRNKILINQALIGFSAFVIPLFLVFEARNFESEFLLHLIFYFLMIIPGILTGIQFSRISMMVGKENSDNGAAAYSADLMGSAGGAILASAILIPLAGFLWTGLVLFGMNVLIILVNVIRKI
jgi:spermidine synthase